MFKNKERNLIVVFIILLFVMSTTLINRNSNLDVDSVVYSIKNSICLNADIDDTYYKIVVSDEFFTLLQVDSWEKAREFSLNDPLLIINYAERHNIYLYSDGRAVIYDGYAGFLEKSEAYYTVPEDIVEKLSIYIIENGIANPQGVKDTTFL